MGFRHPCFKRSAQSQYVGALHALLSKSISRGLRWRLPLHSEVSQPSVSSADSVLTLVSDEPLLQPESARPTEDAHAGVMCLVLSVMLESKVMGIQRLSSNDCPALLPFRLMLYNPRVNIVGCLFLSRPFGHTLIVR